jgi:hypothetical protein
MAGGRHLEAVFEAADDFTVEASFRGPSSFRQTLSELFRHAQ